MDDYPLPIINTRLGFHYFPDAFHYRESDLAAWLPELRALGASWVTLTAPVDRAIPEAFIEGLVRAGIEPIIRFQHSLSEPGNIEDLKLFFESYGKWGVHYIVLFDRPNLRSSWPVATWAQEDLVERFLDRFLPLAECALDAGLYPVFPPLEPGGDYWDTAFLHAALLSLKRRKQNRVLDKLVLSAYAYTGERSLNWGAGGPERWPGAHPYFTPADEQDQRGFRIFDWYLAIARSVQLLSCPILLFGAGTPSISSTKPSPAPDPTRQTEDVLSIAQLLAGETVSDHDVPDGELDLVPPEVIGCNFWVLATAPTSPYAPQAWFQTDGQSLSVVGALRQWMSSSGKYLASSKAASNDPSKPPIAHYLLLPTYEWGIADWHLEIIRPFVKKHQPTIGFSLAEAARASRVTVIGGPQVFSDEVLDRLRMNGCMVERICGDGTSIASQLAER